MSEYLPVTNFCKYSSAVRISRKVRLSIRSLSFDCKVSSKSEKSGKYSAEKAEQSVFSVMPILSYVSTTRLLMSSMTSTGASASTILKKLSNIFKCVLNVTLGSAGVPSSVSILYIWKGLILPSLALPTSMMLPQRFRVSDRYSASGSRTITRVPFAHSLAMSVLRKYDLPEPDLPMIMAQVENERITVRLVRA